LLLAGSLPLLVGLTDHAPRARAVWGLAGTVGAALGPALGGVLTELFTWRSIFLVQAPVAALALVAVASPRVRAAAHDRPGPTTRRMVVANLGYLLLFAALVGALFLAVLLVIVVWGLTPIEGALVVSTLPVGALLVRLVLPGLPRWMAASAGGILLAGGLLALAFLPASSAAYAMPALGFCGCGLGMLSGVLGPESLPPGAGLLRSATLSIGARHLGFVLGLVIIAPLLAGQLQHRALDAEKASTAVILDSRLGIREKIPLALDLRNLVEQTPRGQVPDLEKPFNDRGAATRADLRQVRDDLHEAIISTITRAFRSSFGLAAVFAALAAVPALGLALVRRRTP
jgi:hypothetical protein